MNRFIIASAILLGLAGCDDMQSDPRNVPLEGVLKDVRFNLGGEMDNCMVEFTDGRVFCFDNGEGFLFQKGRVNRIHRRRGGRWIKAVEIMGAPR